MEVTAKLTTIAVTKEVIADTGVRFGIKKYNIS